MNPRLVPSLIAITAVIGMLDALPGLAQSSKADQAFEVVSVKENHGCGGPGRGRGSGGKTSPGRITLECAELRDLILTAYGIYASGGAADPRAFRMQVLGGPGWIDSSRYDVAAKADGNPPLTQMYGPMLRALLEDRFKLKIHRETKEVPVYLLTVAKGGPRLKAAKAGSCIPTDINHPLPQLVPGQPRPRACGSQVTATDGTFEMYGATMAELSTQLAIRSDRDVIDKTGIAGMFDIHLEASRADLMPRFLAGRGDPSSPPLASDSTGPSIFTALQQQLGLKLESGKNPVEFLVIDQIEKPSEN
jgi:uncharacterized protein (TIGR03435 family)